MPAREPLPENMILFPTCTQSELKTMLEARTKGYTYAECGRFMGVSSGTAARYLRGFDNFGINAFARG